MAKAETYCLKMWFKLSFYGLEIKVLSEYSRRGQWKWKIYVGECCYHKLKNIHCFFKEKNIVCQKNKKWWSKGILNQLPGWKTEAMK